MGKLYSEPKVTVFERADRRREACEAQLDTNLSSLLEIHSTSEASLEQPAMLRAAVGLLPPCAVNEGTKPLTGLNGSFLLRQRQPLAPTVGSPKGAAGQSRASRPEDDALPMPMPMHPMLASMFPMV